MSTKLLPVLLLSEAMSDSESVSSSVSEQEIEEIIEDASEGVDANCEAIQTEKVRSQKW